MNNNKRLNSERLVLKRQKETVYYRNIRLKRRKQDPRSQRLPLSPKKEKIQDSLEISSKSTRKLAVATRIKREHACSDIQHSRFSQQNPSFSSETRFRKRRRPLLCVLFARPNFSRRKTKRNDSQITHIRALLFERKRDSSSLSLSLCEQKHIVRRECESQSTKKTFANIPLTRRNLLRIYVTRNQKFAQKRQRERMFRVYPKTLNKKSVQLKSAHVSLSHS